MTARWFLRWVSHLPSNKGWPHLYFDGMRSGYREPGEHKETATFTTFEDGVYKVWVLTADRVPAFAAQYIERTTGQPATSPELD